MYAYCDSVVVVVDPLTDLLERSVVVNNESYPSDRILHSD